MPVMDETTPMKFDLPVYLTAKDMCRMFQTSSQTLTRWEIEWGCPVIRVGDGPRAVRRYPLIEVEAWFKSRCSDNREAVA